jgi:hypothetical protein
MAPGKSGTLSALAGAGAMRILHFCLARPNRSGAFLSKVLYTIQSSCLESS